MLTDEQDAKLRELLTAYAAEQLTVAENNAFPSIVDAAYQRRDAALLILGRVN